MHFLRWLPGFSRILCLDSSCIAINSYYHFWFSMLRKLAIVIRVASTVDAVLLSHPDTLHLGALPYAMKQLGLSAPVFATEPVFRLGLLTMYDQYLSRKVKFYFGNSIVCLIFFSLSLSYCYQMSCIVNWEFHPSVSAHTFYLCVEYGLGNWLNVVVVVFCLFFCYFCFCFLRGVGGGRGVCVEGEYNSPLHIK